MDCKVVSVSSKKVIGMEYRGKNENGEIPKLWEVFMQKYTQIKTPSSENMYGLYYDYDENNVFTSFAGLEVSEITSIPEGMVIKEIPSRDYAVFTFKGHISEIGAFWEKIYTEYMQKNNLVPDYGLSFELYDERFAKSGECDIYVPIKK